MNNFTLFLVPALDLVRCPLTGKKSSCLKALQDLKEYKVLNRRKVKRRTFSLVIKKILNKKVKIKKK
jgi:hypothetical protein